jgi:hypothetical protein
VSDAERDRDWTLALGSALGFGSGLTVPLVPDVEACREMFARLKVAHSDSVDAVQKQMGAKLAEQRARADIYEREYILPTFRWAKAIGFDLERAVSENAGKNCVVLFFEHMKDRAEAAEAELAEAERRALCSGVEALPMDATVIRTAKLEELKQRVAELEAEANDRTTLDKKTLERLVDEQALRIAALEGGIVAENKRTNVIGRELRAIADLLMGRDEDFHPKGAATVAEVVERILLERDVALAQLACVRERVRLEGRDGLGLLTILGNAQEDEP